MSSGSTKSLPNGDSELIDENMETEESSENVKETADLADRNSKEKPEDEKEGEGSSVDGQEVVLIQDTGFTIQIVCPGTEPFELPVGILFVILIYHS